ncbi:MAG: hypothetical protein AAGF24_15465 [Cyanobacteria bacterium P01_H01_bin.121]
MKPGVFSRGKTGDLDVDAVYLLKLAAGQNLFTTEVLQKRLTEVSDLSLQFDPF